MPGMVMTSCRDRRRGGTKAEPGGAERAAEIAVLGQRDLHVEIGGDQLQPQRERAAAADRQQAAESWCRRRSARAGSRGRRRRRLPSPPASGAPDRDRWLRPTKRAAGVGIVVRRALAARVGQEDFLARTLEARLRPSAESSACFWPVTCDSQLRLSVALTGSRPSGARCRGWRGRRRARRRPCWAGSGRC